MGIQIMMYINGGLFVLVLGLAVAAGCMASGIKAEESAIEEKEMIAREARDKERRRYL